jgi:ABC-type transporter Mla subunit MlaD
MNAERQGKEWIAGLFLLIGLVTIGALALFFGARHDARDTYQITMEFPNAHGLAANADVLLNGARIGKVMDSPKLTGKAFSVGVTAQISDRVAIPRASKVVIRANGMLGDLYVDVVPPEAFDPKDVIQPNETIIGQRDSDLKILISRGPL